MHDDPIASAIDDEPGPNETIRDELIRDELISDELLIEEISIDGMCGVY